jgi:hypothetical protein
VKNSKKVITGTLLFFSVLFAACGTNSPNIVTTQLQIREYQTKIFDAESQRLVMKAVADTLQDLGFIIKNANTDLGLLIAEKDVDIESKGEAFLAVLFGGANARWKKLSKEEVTVNISKYGKSRTKVRVNAVIKIIDNKGGILKVEPIKDEKYYQDFFAKVSKSIFIAKQNL